MTERRDEFLSEEDLGIGTLSVEEIKAYWRLRLDQAQSTHDVESASYSHGVFDRDPAVSE